MIADETAYGEYELKVACQICPYRMILKQKFITSSKNVSLSK